MGNSQNNAFKSFKGVEWKGYLIKDQLKTDFVIANMICDTLGRLSGQGKDKVGSYTIFGFVDPQGIFTFQKVYKKAKFNTPENPVFKAQFQAGFLSGVYTGQGVKDNFFLKLTNAALYAGHYLRTDIPYPLNASLYLQVDQKHGVFGVGCDHNGFYVALGQKLKDDKETKKGGFTKFFFTVSYLGKFQIQHHATGRKGAPGMKALTGFWLNDSLKLRGTFELNEIVQAINPPVNPGPHQTHVQQDQLLHQSMFGALNFNNQEYVNIQNAQ